VFAERGYQLTTMMDIGAALGIRGPRDLYLGLGTQPAAQAPQP
jgi:hypothetical protein